MTTQQEKEKKPAEMAYVPTPRPGGYLKIKTDVKEKKNKKLKFDDYQPIISRVEDMERKKFQIEKTLLKNPIPPTITPIKDLNLPKISQESLFDKYLFENEDNGENQGEYLRWLEETAPAKDTNFLDNLEEAITFIATLASKPNLDAKEFNETQAFSVVQFLRTIKSPAGQYEANNDKLMQYIDEKARELQK